MTAFTADFSTNHLDSFICETSSPRSIFTEAKFQKKYLESFSSSPSSFGYLGKETKNPAEHVNMKKIFIYARACVNKEFVHSGSIGLISPVNELIDLSLTATGVFSLVLK